MGELHFLRPPKAKNHGRNGGHIRGKRRVGYLDRSTKCRAGTARRILTPKGGMRCAFPPYVLHSGGAAVLIALAGTEARPTEVFQFYALRSGLIEKKRRVAKTHGSSVVNPSRMAYLIRSAKLLKFIFSMI